MKVEGGEIGRHEMGRQRVPLLSACTPATSSREPTRPGQSRPAGTPGAHTHPGGMNTPEGVVMGAGGFLQEDAPAERRTLRRLLLLL